VTYTETVTRDGETTIASISDTAALAVLRRGQRLGCAVSALLDGTVTITRTVLRLADENATETQVTVTLSPDAKPRRLTKAQYENLKWIRAAGARAVLRPDGRIGDVFCQIPQATAKRLFNYGIAVVTAGGLVEISVAGLLAIAAYEHPARTTRPRGWHDRTDGSLNRPRVQRMHPYQANDRTSAAVCTCGFHRTLDERTYAVAAKNGHLAEVLSAALVAA
jgi:hypothetical protein